MSQFIWAKCDDCGNEMNVPYHYRGTQQRCRKCGEGFTVPDPEAEEAQAPGIEEIDRQAQATLRSRVKFVALSAAAGLLVVLIIFVALLIWERSTVAPSTIADLVRKTLSSDILVTQVDEGPLRDGTAVLINDQAAYWVCNGEVRAANTLARTWSPGIRRAPAGVDAFLVQGAVNPAPPTDAELVKETLSSEIVVTQIADGPLHDGTAVLVNDQAAYWVSDDGEVLAANDVASKWSPGIDKAGSKINFSLVQGAVNPGPEADANPMLEAPSQGSTQE